MTGDNLNVELQQTTRWCAVEGEENPSPAGLRQAILRGEKVQTDFSVITAPLPARDQTVFKVRGREKELLVAIALFESVNRSLPAEQAPMTDSAEIYFDLRHDRLGWFRFEFTPDGKTNSSSFLPYPEAHASNFPFLRLTRHETNTEYFPSMNPGSFRCRWIYAWFDASQIFRESAVCGFNVCRYRPDNSYEFSSWNYLSGNGGPDATAFGNLHRVRPSVRLSDVTAIRDKNQLTLTGKATGTKSLQWELHTPLGERLEAQAQFQKNQWQVSLPLKTWPHGRYRLIPVAGKNRVEPAAFYFDLAPVKGKQKFVVSATWDWPDNIMSNHYTPQRLAAEAKIMAGWGIERLHWIDYSDSPSMMAAHYWDDNHRQTVKHCGDVVKCAVRQAHESGMEIIADFKVFDIGINSFHMQHASTVLEMEGCRSVAIPEIVAHREWTLQSHTGWRRETSFPITRLRFYSKTLYQISLHRTSACWSVLATKITKNTRGHSRCGKAE
jgi:hypothetical protein